MYQGVEPPNLQNVSCRPRHVCVMTFPTLFDTGTLDGFQGAVIFDCFPELCFSIFHGAGVCGVANAIYKQFCFSPLAPVLPVLIIILILL